MSHRNPLIALLFVGLFAPTVAANPGDPVALVRLPGGAISIQPMGGLSVKIGNDTAKASDEAVLVTIDQVRIAVINSTKISNDEQKRMESCDALVANVGEHQLQDAVALAKRVSARRLIVPADAIVAGARKQLGNTLPISAASGSQEDSDIQIIQLGATPVDLSPEVVALIERKEASCRASQKVFAKLSVDQMNFRPSNGSHTPRWNAEHMMGRELLFFSQIYHAKDPSIPVMDLNPKQMPPDYQAKHPDWTGEEEAKQMERVTAFTRRFAYLLNDLPLDKKAPASRWTPRGLLKQMERHYNEHTANVKLKFKLPDWPKK